MSEEQNSKSESEARSELIRRLLEAKSASAPKESLQEALQEERDAPLEIPEDFYPNADPRVRASKFWAVTRLLCGDRVFDITRKLGISSQAFSNWRREPDFNRFLKESVELEFGEYSTKLRVVAPRSIEVLATAQEHVDPNIRIKAAGRLLTSMDRLLDRAAGLPTGGGGQPLIIFPPGTQVSLTMSGPQSVPIDIQSTPSRLTSSDPEEEQSA